MNNLKVFINEKINKDSFLFYSITICFSVAITTMIVAILLQKRILLVATDATSNNICFVFLVVSISSLVLLDNMFSSIGIKRMYGLTAVPIIVWMLTKIKSTQIFLQIVILVVSACLIFFSIFCIFRMGNSIYKFKKENNNSDNEQIKIILSMIINIITCIISIVGIIM